MVRRARSRTIECAYILGFVLTWTLALSSQELDLIDCEGEWADSQLCKEREEAFEFKSRVDSLFDELPELENPPWDRERHGTANSDYEKAMEHYNNGYFGDASTVFESVLESLLSLKSEFEETTARTEEIAFSLLAEEKYGEAIPLLKNLDLWIPASPKVAEGIVHANKGIELDSKVGRIEELIENQAFDEAEVKLASLPEGYWQQRIGIVQQKLSNFRQQQSFNSLMSQGLERLDAKEWGAAYKSFQAALKLSPSSVVAKESMEEAHAQLTKSTLDALYEQLADQEIEEQWEGMLQTLAEINKWDANEKVTTVQKHLQLLLTTEVLLTQAISKASEPMSKQQRTEVQELLASTENLDTHGRIQEKRALLQKEFDRNTRPVTVTVISDGKTNVLVRPGQSLGAFSKKVLDIYPGTYDFIGRRNGYHETRQSVTVKPDSKGIEVRIVCDVRF